MMSLNLHKTGLLRHIGEHPKDSSPLDMLALEFVEYSKGTS